MVDCRSIFLRKKIKKRRGGESIVKLTLLKYDHNNSLFNKERNGPKL